MATFTTIDGDALATTSGGWQHRGLPSNPDASCSELQELKDDDDYVVSRGSFLRKEFGRRSRYVAGLMQNKGCTIAPNKYEPDGG